MTSATLSLANKQLEALSHEANRVGLVVNIDKTEYMAFNQPDLASTVSLNGQQLKRVNDFKYLGTKVASSEGDFKHRRALVWVAFWEMEKLWQSKQIPLSLKLNIFNAAVISIFLYGCETWIINENMASKTNSFAISCFPILLGIKRIDKITNERIYQLQRIDRQPLMHAVRRRQTAG